MNKAAFDALVERVKDEVNAQPVVDVFPLDQVLTLVHAQQAARRDLGAAGAFHRPVTEEALALLAMFDVTGVSAALAIKKLSVEEVDSAGLTAALVDLWGRSEAARCLWFDAHGLFHGSESDERLRALNESASVLAPEAISIAFRLSVPVAQYVEFVSKVIV